MSSVEPSGFASHSSLYHVTILTILLSPSVAIVSYGSILSLSLSCSTHVCLSSRSSRSSIHLLVQVLLVWHMPLIFSPVFPLLADLSVLSVSSVFVDDLCMSACSRDFSEYKMCTTSRCFYSSLCLLIFLSLVHQRVSWSVHVCMLFSVGVLNVSLSHCTLHSAISALLMVLRGSEFSIVDDFLRSGIAYDER